ncbi:MAG TPA: sn-glycerol-3-phosphate ABC transporter ATP-binding protein UgpC [Castellaniella sp.]|uniref:ABC transporter ATP-binding protein n=1 Tax=Castellaniella sp. TaxID=1955812 RepID=UPI002F08380C
MAIVSVEHVTKSYGKTIAVHEFDLETQDGEFVVLVGPSGCGKSTTLRMLAGLEDVSGGRILIDGREVQNVPSKDRDIAMVFQSYALYPHMDVFSNMAFGLKMRGTPKSEILRRVRDAASILDIEPLLERKPRELSGGQRQRVALGRAIVREPQVFLMDEPLSNLDAQLRAGMRAEILKLHQRLGVTAFYVTHDQVEAMTMGQRIVVMREGWIQQISTPLGLYDRPANRFVAGFIGNPAMNFLKMRVDADGKRLQAAFGGIGLPDRLLAAVQSHRDREVWVGVRPEDLSVAAQADTDVLTGTVELIEPLGSVSDVRVNVEGAVVVAQISRESVVRVGETLRLRGDTAHLHLFDTESDVNLLDRQ